MIFEIIKATLMGALPVATFTFLILQWSVASGRMPAFSDGESLQKQFKAHAKAQKEARKAKKSAEKAQIIEELEQLANGQTADVKSSKGEPMFHRRTGGDMFHNKIMSFGGGFYGTMAVMTYLIIEVIEIWDFLAVVFTPGSWFSNLGFDLIIGFIINSVMNFVAAFIWFITLADLLPVDNGWIWLGAAYVGYLVGLRLVKQQGDDIWTKILAGVAELKTRVANKLYTAMEKSRSEQATSAAKNKASADEKD